MRHLASLSAGQSYRKPVHIECSCGTAGDFTTEAEARYWMEHKHFAKLTGIAYGEFSSAPTPSEPTPKTESASEGQKKSQPATPLQNETLGDA